MANNYKESTHREQYESIAEKFGTTPEYVYSLAHGMKSTTHLDNEILELLEKQHIVQVKRHRHHHKHHHSLISSEHKRLIWNIIFIIFVIAAIYFIRKISHMELS